MKLHPYKIIKARKAGNVKNAAKMRIRLAEAQNWRCCYCTVIMAVTIEHLIPLSQGGSNAWLNLLAACHDCNSGRGSKDAYVYWRARSVQVSGEKKKRLRSAA